MSLEGHVALVTGAGRGIGRGCALALAEEGAHVALLSRSQPELESVAAEIEERGGRASVHAADVTDPESLASAFAEVDVQGPLRVCVNSAGVNRPAPTLDLTLEDWDLVQSTNVRGTFLACRAAGGRMVGSERGGRIVNISSQMGAVGYPGRAAYCASKHAVNGLTKALAVEWAPEGVTVNAVAPTFINTPMTAPMFADADFKADVLSRIPAGRIGEVADVVGAVRYLVSDAADLVTGHVLAVDGGWVSW